MDNILMHKFRVGQTVNLVPRTLYSAAAGEYEIRHLLPPPDTEPTSPRYRIKNMAEKHERVASENELSLSNPLGSVFS